MRPCQAFHVLKELRNSSDAPLYRKAVRLSRRDADTVKDVYQQWLSLLLDLGYLHPNELERTARRLWLDITRVDVLDLNNSFAECLQRIRLQNTKGFKVLCSQISTHLFPLIKGDVKLVEESNEVAAGKLMQIFAYTSRLTLHEIDLSQQMIADYMHVEDNLPTNYACDFLPALNEIIKSWLSAFEPYPLFPKHGPGAVAGLGRCSIQEKYQNLFSDDRIRYVFPDCSEWTDSSKTLERTSQTIFVPKSYKSFRTISMEPATLQYLQQAVWGAIDHQIASKYYLREHIDVHDQTRNCYLARWGSLGRHYATLDLSAASDSVSYALIKEVFKGTWLLKYLVCLRSTHSRLPDGSIVELKKFAPMGSSLCFPIETLVFASICEYVTRTYGHRSDYSVYGDDIIVPTECAIPTIELLSQLGFKTNAEKSYMDYACWFRESCGGEYCNSIDVTPLRISRKYNDPRNSENFQALVSLANNCYERGYRHLRHFFLEKLRNEGWLVLFSPNALKGDSETNYHLKSRYNDELQRVEYLCHSLVDTSSGESYDEEIRLRHWFESSAPCNPQEHRSQTYYESIRQQTLRIVSECRTWKSNVRVKLTWRPSYCEVDNFVRPEPGPRKRGTV